MTKLEELERWITGCKIAYQQRKKILQEGIERTNQKRQEQTGKPLRRE